MLKIHFSQNDMRNMMLIQQTLIQYLLQKKNLCEIFKVLTIWGNINLFIRPQHHYIMLSVFLIIIARPRLIHQLLLPIHDPDAFYMDPHLPRHRLPSPCQYSSTWIFFVSFTSFGKIEVANAVNFSARSLT